MTHNTRDFAARIRSQGFRLTPQRQLILDAICASGGHISLDAICKRVQAQAPAVNRSTIYRNLEFLQSVQLVVAADIGGTTVYEIAHEHPHHHLICESCGAEAELDQALLASAFAAIQRENGFEVTSDHLVLVGLCRRCQQ